MVLSDTWAIEEGNDIRHRRHCVLTDLRPRSPARELPSKNVAVSLVNSLEGFLSRMIRQKSYPGIRKRYALGIMVPKLLRGELLRRTHLRHCPVYRAAADA